VRIVQAPCIDAAMVATPPGGGNGKTFLAREGFFFDSAEVPGHEDLVRPSGWNGL